MPTTNISEKEFGGNTSVEKADVVAQIENLNNAVNDLRANDDKLDKRLTTTIENMVDIIKGLLERVEALEKK